jgi:CheY-specific phosphatase CheX
MILDSLILQAKLFLTEDMNIEINNVDMSQIDSDQLNLKQHTSMIGVGGKLNLMAVISFDDDILAKLVELFMDGEEVEEDEADEVKESVTGEVINTILGLALPTFPNRGKGVTITPPISINDTSSLKKHKNSNILSATISTNHGTLSISAIGENIK